MRVKTSRHESGRAERGGMPWLPEVTGAVWSAMGRERPLRPRERAVGLWRRADLLRDKLVTIEGINWDRP